MSKNEISGKESRCEFQSWDSCGTLHSGYIEINTQLKKNIGLHKTLKWVLLNYYRKLLFAIVPLTSTEYLPYFIH